jgi:acyl-CoA synthetase (AMP-forming)/AMP-acid ligase II
MIAPLHGYLEYHARVRPQTVFGIFRGHSVTYAAANAQANRLAHALLRSGMRPGDRIAYLSKNSLDMALMYFGAAKTGVVPVPLNYRLAPIEWDYIVRDCRARLLVAQEAYVPDVDTLRDQLEFVEQFIVTDGERRGWSSAASWLIGAPESNPDGGVEVGDPVYQMYTSGTTGRPKGAVLTHASVVTNCHQSMAALGTIGRPGERILVVMPMYHAGAMSFVVGGVVNAASMLFHEDFSAALFLDALEVDDIVSVNVVPAMIQACIDHTHAEPPRCFPKLRLVIYGASPIADCCCQPASPYWGRNCESWTPRAGHCPPVNSARSLPEVRSSCRAIGTNRSRRPRHLPVAGCTQAMSAS